MLKYLLAALAAVFIPFSHASAVDIYVSPGGSDGNPGTAAAPFQTIARARDQARTLAPKMSADIHVWLADGVYVQKAPLTFDSTDSGQNGCNVIYQAMPGAHPIISGGRRITGWMPHDNARNIWVAAAPQLATRQLYVNGVKAMRARSSTPPLIGATQSPTGYTTTAACPMGAWKNPEDLEFVYNPFIGKKALNGGQWLEPRVDVASISVANGVTTIVMKQPAYSLAMKSDNTAVRLPSYVENAYELLSHPGDWYLDGKAGQIYYIPRPDENLATAEVVAPVLETLVSGIGKPDAPLHNLHFEGLTFAYATWLRPSGNDGYPEKQSNHFTDDTYTPGNLIFQQANHLRFERCVFTKLGATALELSGGVQDTVVIGCRFADISASGILEGTMTDPLRPNLKLRDDNIAIEDCLFNGLGTDYHGSAAILIGYVSHTLIAHNEIEHVPYTGISIGWGWGALSYASDNRILDNYVHDYVEMLGDGGGFYSLSPEPDSEVAGNYFRHQATPNLGGAIYPDEGSLGWDIHNNVADDVYTWLNIWTPTIKNNHVHDNWAITKQGGPAGPINNNGSNNLLERNTAVTKGSPWPEGAQKVINEAGLEAAYKDPAPAQ